jgi:hypothetical protein
MKNRLSLLSITLLLLASALPEWAQTFRGGIAGIITDSSGGILSGSVVKAVNSATGLSRSVLSTSAGEFTFQDLPLGVWQVTVSHPCFRPRSGPGGDV